LISRCMLDEIRSGRGIDGKDYFHLDLTHLGKHVIERKLAEITSFARTYAGVDPVKEPIPVQPTCHYMMGGIATDADGRVIVDEKNTPYAGLYAAGECACVSVHGANRLGCNALLDTLVFGRRAGMQIKTFVKSVARPRLPAKPDKKDAEMIKALMQSTGRETSGAVRAELQENMMENVSVFRQKESLTAALDKIKELKARYKKLSIQDKGSCFNRDLLDAIELGHLLDLAEAITQGALIREESRGAHCREDFPDRDDKNFLIHTMALYDAAKGPQIFTKPVAISKFEPKERKY
jgi:succinate dehydrogenase flavoprotein subunit